MTVTWPLQEAKNKLSEVIDRAAKGGPQVVTRHGKRVAVILSASAYDRLRRPRKTLFEFLRKCRCRVGQRQRHIVPSPA